MRYYIVLLLISFLYTNHIQAQEDNLPLVEEHAVARNLDGWNMIYKRGFVNRYIEEYIPIGETLENWSRMITIERFIKNKENNALNNYAKLKNYLSLGCKSSSISPIKNKVTEDYGLTTYEATCEFAKATDPIVQVKNTEKWYYKLIETDTSLYNIHLAVHGDKNDTTIFDDDKISNWINDLEKIDLCRLSDKNTTCVALGIIPEHSRKDYLENYAAVMTKSTNGKFPFSADSVAHTFRETMAVFTVKPLEEIPTKKGKKVNYNISLDMAKQRWRDKLILQKMLNNIAQAFEQGQNITLTARYRNNKDIDKLKDRVEVANYFILLKDYLNQLVKIPYENISIFMPYFPNYNKNDA